MAADRPFAYVASPYRGETAAVVAANVAWAKEHSLEVYNQGYTPLTPHLLFPQFLNDDDPVQRAAGIAMANSLLRLCRVVVLCGDKISEGMAAETAIARNLGIQITSLNELPVMSELTAFTEIGGVNLKHITTDELKQMTGSEGLILQGCGGDTQEWVDGINNILTEAGILLNGSKFTDISAFEHDGLKNIMFGMDNLNADELDVGKLAIWRLRTHEQFGGTWLSDYLPNKLGVNRDEPEIDGGNSIVADPAASPVFSVCLENAANPDIGGFSIPFPTTAEQLLPWLEKIEAAGLGEEGVALRELRSPIEGLAERIPLEVSLDELNYLAAKISAMDEDERDIFAAAFEADLTFSSLAEVINLAENLDCFELQPAYDASQLGEFFVEFEGDDFALSIGRLEKSQDPEDRKLAAHISRLEKFIDFDAYGKDVAERDGGSFTERGYLVPVRPVSEKYHDERDIPDEFILFKTTNAPVIDAGFKEAFIAAEGAKPLIALQNVNLATTLLEMHGVGGEYMRDARRNICVLANGGTDYLVMMHPQMLTVSRAEDVFHRDTTEHDLWANSGNVPENRAFMLSVTDTDGGRIVGNVCAMDIPALADAVREHSFFFDHFNAEMKDGSNRVISLAEWDLMDRLERDQLKSWTKHYAPSDEARLSDLLGDIRHVCNESRQPVAASTFLSQISQPFMAQAARPEPAMLRVAQEAAREMLATNSARVFRMTNGGVERLSAIDAAKIGQWSADREFAVNKSEFAGVEKWAARASAEIIRQTERGERSKTKANGEEL